MEKTLASAKAALTQALNLSQQGSYRRRAPSKEARISIEGVRNELHRWNVTHGETIEALRLLALAEEALLNYPAAAKLLERVIALAPDRSRKDLKRLASCREAGNMWRELHLSSDELRSLGLYLRTHLLEAPSERTLRWTKQWLSENKLDVQTAVLDFMQQRGYSSDYQVLHNLVAS